MIYDVIIIGAGPAGITAGIYAARAGLKTIIVEKGLPGGLAATTHYIENYPGFSEGIKGIELAEQMKRQVQHFGVEIIGAEVRMIARKNKTFVVKTDGREIEAFAIIIAIGATWKKLNVPGENELRGRGVSYCATCDGPLFRGRDVVVVGCGNSGLQEGKFLLQFVKSITFIEILPHMTADKILQERLKDEKNVRFFLNHEVISVNGKEKVTSITVKDRATNKEKDIMVDGIFIYVGLEPASELLKNIVNLDDYGFVITDERLSTSVPGIFAAGDIRSKEIRQVITACGDGAEAAINAFHYIESFRT